MSTFWQGVLYLHLVAMAFFLGGQLFIAVADLLQAAIFLVTLAIVWVAVELAT